MWPFHLFYKRPLLTYHNMHMLLPLLQQLECRPPFTALLLDLRSFIFTDFRDNYITICIYNGKFLIKLGGLLFILFCHHDI